jgi:arylsulfatase A-like enzyme
MTAVRFAAGIFAGFVLVAAVNAVAIVALVPLPTAGVGLRAAHLVFDAAETLGVGAVLALAGGAFVRLAKSARLPLWATWCAGVAFAVAVALATIREFLVRTATQLFDGRFPTLLFVGYLALIGVGFTDVVRGAIAVADRPRARAALVALAVAGLVANQLVLRDDYFGIHGLAAGAAAIVGGVALAPLAERAGRALSRRLAGRGVFVALFAFVGLAWPPPNAVRYELFRQPAAVAPWILATTVWRAPRLHAPVAAVASRWTTDRSKDPPVPPAAPAVFAPSGPAVVVLLTIDALRGDAANDPSNAALFPALAQLERDGVVFTHASAPGTQTPVSLSTLFSGLYFSEQKWAPHGLGSTRYLYPADDPSPRFPELLSEHGVTTGIYGGLAFLAGDFGVARGFREETIVVQGRRHAQARELVYPLLDRLKRAAGSPGSPPLFLFTHLMDAHAPYDRGRKDGTDYERYLSEVAVADAAVGEVTKALAAQFGDRWALFVSADHGEAFGDRDHGTTGHAKTLYEELLHVPLIARSPRFARRTVDTRVGLIDLGPTILDLFGVGTPATFEGQSLAPLLAGGTASLSRPLLAEGRFRRALTQPDGFKVIDDPRRKIVEAYDLALDPGETRNLFDVETARSDAALAALRAFFDARTRRDGYEVPYEP